MCDNTISIIDKELKSQIRVKIKSILDEDSLADEFNFICDFVHFYANMIAKKTIIISDSLYEGRREGLRYILIPNDYSPEDKGICLLIFDRYSLDVTTVIKEVVVLESNENKVRLISTHKDMNEIGRWVKEIFGFF